MSQIKIEKIDTSESRNNLDKLLEENKNYFLHAPWGSGKTEFLKSNQSKSGKQLVYLDLWRVKDDSTVANTTFRLLCRSKANMIKAVIIICIMISILMTDVVNLGLEKKLLSLGISANILSWIILGASLIALSVAVYQFFKVKSDSIYIKLLSKYNRKNNSRKVLVVDDFDRVDIDKQIESYKVFNVLSGRIPIIFVGDYFKIAKQEDNYLQKIIDRQIELPYVLHPQCIWDSYFDNLQKELNFSINPDFKSLFISEERNLRDQHHFNDYVNLEFFEKGKKRRVQNNQQLMIIYLYLFHKEYYYKLQRGWFPEAEITGESKSREKTVGRFGDVLLDNAIFNNKVEKVIDYVLSSNSEYPSDFLKFRQMYYLFENAINLSLDEIDSILANKDLLKKNIELHGNYSADFYRYVSFLFEDKEEHDDDKYEKDREKIVKQSFELLKENKEFPLVKLVVDRMFKIFISERESEGDYIDTADENITVSIEFFEREHIQNLDTSQIIHFFIEVFNRVSYEGVVEHFHDSIKNNLDNNNLYLKQNRKPYLLITNVWNSDKSWIYPKCWSDGIKEKIKELSDEDFIEFWNLYRIIRVKYTYNQIETYKNIKSVVVIHGMYGQKKFYEEDKTYEEITSLFIERLRILANKEGWKLYEVTDIETQKKYL